MARTYSPEQAAYLQHKATYQTALQVHTAALQAQGFYDALPTAEDRTLVAMEVQAQAMSHMDEALDAFLATEKALFAWGQAQALTARRAKSHKSEVALLKNMFATIHQYAHLKDKLAAICLALDLSA